MVLSSSRTQTRSHTHHKLSKHVEAVKVSLMAIYGVLDASH